MDDCNTVRELREKGAKVVQIPLWTIVTLLIPAKIATDDGFRFLYGRL